MQNAIVQFRCNPLHVDGIRHLKTPIDVAGTELGPEHVSFLCFLLLFCCRVNNDFIGCSGYLDIFGLKTGQRDSDFVCTVLFG